MANVEGIRARHSRKCATKTDPSSRCNCRPTWEAFVYSHRDGRKIRRSFASLSEARAWRHDAGNAVNQGRMRAPTSTTLREAAEAFLAGVEDGSIRNRSGDLYKPSVIRGYRAALEQRILPDLGARKLADVRRADVQALADRMLGDRLDPSTIRNTVMPLRVIYRRAVEDGVVSVNPCGSLRLPAVRGRRDRIASPEEAARLVAALKPSDRALWATALYGGLRLGELLALRWEDVDLAKGLIRVERAYDPKSRTMVEPKSQAGRRTVPVAAVLRDHLLEHKLRHDDGLVFGGARPFTPSTVGRRARTAWKRAKLEPIGLHECRHTFASLMISAGVNAKALSSYMGHASVTTTYDRYGHLMPGSEDEAAELLDAYLARADTQARLAQVGQS